MEDLLRLPSSCRGQLHQVAMTADAEQLVAEFPSLVAANHMGMSSGVPMSGERLEHRSTFAQQPFALDQPGSERLANGLVFGQGSTQHTQTWGSSPRQIDRPPFDRYGPLRLGCPGEGA